jgi:hypothetical protein
MKLIIKVNNFIKCFFGNHDWKYKLGNYHTGKDVFKCESCGKEIEE